MNKTGTVPKLLATVLVLSSFATNAQNRIDTQRPDAPTLAAYGEYAIGVRTLEMSNPGQLDILRMDASQPEPANLPRYDRPLTVEIWYPAKPGQKGETTLRVYLRDAITEVDIEGKAIRNAAPSVGNYPLIIISHGYPGNRYLLAHLGENLASKGYIVASIDHTDSTYRTMADFASTLVNRPLDQIFVLNQMQNLTETPSSFLYQKVDVANTALIGYSMGGYGALITAGGGLTAAALASNLAPAFGTLNIHKSNSHSHTALSDERIKTAILFGPWGMNVGLWDAESLLGIKTPMLLIAGSQDDVSGYRNGIRAIWAGAKSVDRTLVTFENANHNAGAPMPAPQEAFRMDKNLGFNVSEHYTDAVWSNERMNNVAQHFVTAWVGKYLKADSSMHEYLDLVEDANNGVWSVEKNGTPKADHTYWKGFPKRTAKGLYIETLETGH